MTQPGCQAVHGVGGDALGGVDGGGVAETGRLADVVGRESDRVVAAGVPDRQVAFSADVGDGPVIAVWERAWEEFVPFLERVSCSSVKRRG